MGHWKVLQVHSDGAARVDMPAYLSQVHPVIHPSFLRRSAKAGTESVDGQRLDGATDLAGLFDRPEFGVKEILAHRMLRKKLQYLVRWEGCSYLQSTWEDAASLAKAPKVVKTYKAKTKQRDMSLRAESAWACMTSAPSIITDSAWRINKGQRYGLRTWRDELRAVELPGM